MGGENPHQAKYAFPTTFAKEKKKQQLDKVFTYLYV